VAHLEEQLTMSMNELVECYSGIDYAGRPQVLIWQGERLEVTEVLTSWRTPQGKGFQVRVGTKVFVLFYDEIYDAWSIEIRS
jgi:hypothetical protein